MSSSTLQFVVVGALIAAWAWMLGRPILTNMFRRSRRDSVGHFRYQQAVLGQSMVHDLHTSATPEASPVEMTDFDDAGDVGIADHGLAEAVGPAAPDSRSNRRRPIADWLAQPVERRRLQLMLGFAIATFVSLLMAIALRGTFIRLFLLLAICFVAYICIAALIGASQLRRAEREFAANYQAPVAGADPGTGTITGLAISDAQSMVDTLDSDTEAASILEGLETYEDLEHFGQGIFDDEFFEPIPELAFQPLGFESATEDEGHVDFESEFELQDELEVDDESAEFSFDYESPFDYTPLSGSDLSQSGPSEPAFAETVLWADLDEPEQVAAYQPEQGDFFEPAPAEHVEEYPVGQYAADEYTPDEYAVEYTGDEYAVDEPAHVAEYPADEYTAPEYTAEQADNQRSEPTFTAAPEQRPRVTKRNKARPIYIESQLDEEAEQIKAVND
ncbi:MAG: hypothetical protein ACRBK7_19535 [Acidimicrobiales bacterium]